MASTPRLLKKYNKRRSNQLSYWLATKGGSNPPFFISTPMSQKKGAKRFAEIFWFSDSEPNEVLIAFCHLVALAASLIVEFEHKSFLLCIGAIAAGIFQMWAVLYNGTLKMRLLAVQIATLIAISTVLNLYWADLLSGSRVGWVIIMLFAAWNTVRVFNEKLHS